jgi:hypothetical protein
MIKEAKGCWMLRVFMMFLSKRGRFVLVDELIANLGQVEGGVSYEAIRTTDVALAGGRVIAAGGNKLGLSSSQGFNDFVDVLEA